MLGSGTGNAFVEKLRNGFHMSNKAGIELELFWMPRHVVIKGNEMADHHAEQASIRPAELIPIPYSDYLLTIGRKCGRFAGVAPVKNC